MAGANVPLPRRLLTVAGAAQVGAVARSSCFPFHRSPAGSDTVSTGSLTDRRGPDDCLRGSRGRCYHPRMLEDLDALARKVHELAQLAQSLRTENQQLRAQLTAATAELESLRGRVEQATQRLDAMLERLPAAAPAATTGTQWNT